MYPVRTDRPPRGGENWPPLPADRLARRRHSTARSGRAAGLVRGNDCVDAVPVRLGEFREVV
jgi:hypothetical protein